MSDEVGVTRSDRTLIITINRPKVRNAVNAAVAQGVALALDDLDRDDSLTVGIITGAGGTFCAGMDLKAFVNGEFPVYADRGFAGLAQAPPQKPLVAAVEGYALAGGCEIVLACDLVVAAKDAWFGLPEPKRGLVAGAGGLIRLPARIPAGIAMEYALTGDHFSATDARTWGLVNRLTDPGGALDSALELAKRISENGPLAVRVTKRIVLDAPTWPAGDIWQRQQAVMEPVLSSADAQEGARAFTEKRPPVWTGS